MNSNSGLFMLFDFIPSSSMKVDVLSKYTAPLNAMN